MKSKWGYSIWDNIFWPSNWLNITKKKTVEKLPLTTLFFFSPIISVKTIITEIQYNGAQMVWLSHWTSSATHHNSKRKQHENMRPKHCNTLCYIQYNGLYNAQRVWLSHWTSSATHQNSKEETARKHETKTLKHFMLYSNFWPIFSSVKLLFVTLIPNSNKHYKELSKLANKRSTICTN